MSLSAVRSLVQSLRHLLHAWWRVDRIRTSPRDGRLLRLHPPCFVEIDGKTFEVTHRFVGRDDTGPFVMYDCRDVAGSAKLFVQLLSESSRTRIQWADPGSERALDEQEVFVFEPATR